MDHGKNEYITKKIKAYGIVQGVGFRPLVYRIAKKYKVTGTVRNVGGYVEILAQAEGEAVERFLQELKQGNLGGAEIVKLESEEIKDRVYDDFIIIRSKESEEVSIIPPDLPVCPDCQRELYGPEDRRYQNPFISCMSCGPRYTIIEELPYDRHHTTMKDFAMCPACEEEYTSPESRRFHAQTISCDDCGPYLIYHENKAAQPLEHNPKKTDPKCSRSRDEGHLQEEPDFIEQEAFDEAVSVLQSGGILAVKGIGGYHFVCSPFLEETVEKLRKLKGREEKPFAVMFETTESIKEYCMVSEEEEALLETKPRPIVLLYLKKDDMAPSTNKESIYCGAFLPYTPLQLLLTRHCGPLIMTSANVSGTPVIREDEKVLSITSSYLNGVIYNQRRIVRSVDDSVAKVIDGKPQLIRRSRGYVPYPVFLSEERENGTLEKPLRIFAAGGDLKAAFCLYQNGSAVVSQYFGDLEEVTVMNEYKKSFEDLLQLLKLSPELAVCDLHPNYFSSEFAKSLGLPVLSVQHHHAHIASVMAEHDLKERIIGVAFDGTGYGTDGNVWGGEFLVCEEAEFIRAAHLKYTPMLGGDSSMRDAKKTASCYLLEAGLPAEVKDERRDMIQSALEHHINTVLTSSMGRLFDAVSSILDIRHNNRYEGECAAFLEREAVLAQRSHTAPEKITFEILENSGIIEMDARPVLESLCSLRGKTDSGSLALGFHYAVADAIGKVCEKIRMKYRSNKVALSGGVFQNSVLTQKTLSILREKGFEVYCNIAVPPNDGSISLGQTYLGLLKGRQE
jgi:hydrogenase maturation protein HypF